MTCGVRRTVRLEEQILTAKKAHGVATTDLLEDLRGGAEEHAAEVLSGTVREHVALFAKMTK